MNKILLATAALALGVRATLASAGPPHGGGRYVGPYPGGVPTGPTTQRSGRCIPVGGRVTGVRERAFTSVRRPTGAAALCLGRRVPLPYSYDALQLPYAWRRWW